MLRSVGLLLVAAGCMATPGVARAFNCARVNTTSGVEGASLAWFSRTIAFTLFAAGTEDIPGDAERDVLRASFAVWAGLELGADAPDCGLTTDVDLAFVETALSTTDRVGYDYFDPAATENLLIFRDSGWNSAENNVIALTTTTYDPVSGEILDADIEFNSTVFDFTIADDDVSMDLKNTAVHEIGHFLGLAHTSSAFPRATMAARAVPGETEKRDLACDDAGAVTFKYPADAENGYCSPPTPSCGNCAPPDSATTEAIVRISAQSASGDLGGGCNAVAASWSMLVVVALLLRRRRSARQALFTEQAMPANWSR
ncbi:MAG: matrixin family metalloprotease [Myxococcota bacterium]